jgi:chemotaxis protein CheZ
MNVTPPAASSSEDKPELYKQLGQLTRELHDTLCMLGVLPKLQDATSELPDARSRLSYIATKTAHAAETVLNLVDDAKQDQSAIAAATHKLAEQLVRDPVKAVASGAVMNFVQEVEETTQRVDAHLTDIMMAQDFHDLTGQVVAKVVKLASDLEDQLVHLLVQAAPPEDAKKLTTTPTEPAAMPKQADLSGPAINPEGNPAVVSSQTEVDDLLASLGF